MSDATSGSGRSAWWVYWICTLLLCASAINYMDRQTLSNVSKRIKNEFSLTNEQYGDIELSFGIAFAVGALVFGTIADRCSVRWLYPFVLLAWSAMGFATGFVQGYASMLLCRLFLGFFEAGHWPCALKTTQRLLPEKNRTLGNSVLQSGTAIGAIITPLIMKAMLTDAPGSWRPAFQVIGLVGIAWAFLWWMSVRAQDLPVETASSLAATDSSATEHVSWFSVLADRRFWLLIVVVNSINLCWHLFRVWLPLFLQDGRGYSEDQMLTIMFWFNIGTDVGCLSAGAVTAFLAANGYSVFNSRTLVFTFCCLLTALTALIPWLPAGPPLLAVVMLVGMGSLGQFPCYYAYTQELSRAHLGKVSGLLGTIVWLVTSPMHKLFGIVIDVTGSYDAGLAISGLLPLIACVTLWLFWPRGSEASPRVEPPV